LSKEEIHSFGGVPDGAAALGGLIIVSRGMLYGTTSDGGTNNLGTVFSLAF
jgi:uncharacterized repeat protein (TIGR03803 family)